VARQRGGFLISPAGGGDEEGVVYLANQKYIFIVNLNLFEYSITTHNPSDEGL
jgi:hypothetical protein